MNIVRVDALKWNEIRKNRDELNEKKKQTRKVMKHELKIEQQQQQQQKKMPKTMAKREKKLQNANKKRKEMSER